MNDVIKDHKPTFADLVKIEPRLGELYDEAKNYEVSEGYKHDHVWYWNFKNRMLYLVGMMAENDDPVIRTSQSYDTAYKTIFEALPYVRK